MKPILAALTLLLTATDSHAWRCEGWLIDPGLSLYEVSQKCGEPDAYEYWTAWRTRPSTRGTCSTDGGLFRQDSLFSSQGIGPFTHSMLLPFQPSTHTRCSADADEESYAVQIRVLYYDESVPKALHFQNGRLYSIEDLWGMRH